MVRIVAGTYHVESERQVLECSLRGRVKHRDEDARVAVGDEVRVERLPDGSCRICERLPRRSALTRHGVARRRAQVIVANVDQVAAVVSLTAPAPDFSLVDRLLVLAELDALEGFVVANKADLAAEAAGASASPEGPPEGFEPYVEAGYAVLTTSARARTGLGALRERLDGRTTVFAGPSGVGKSSLLNVLAPGLDLRVGDVGARRGRGRHTTVSAALHRIGEEAYVADTPGLQVLALWKVEARALSDAFPELRARSPGCRFADCRHHREPGCAVRAAVETGAVPARRHESYLALLREAEEGRR